MDSITLKKYLKKSTNVDIDLSNQLCEDFFSQVKYRSNIVSVNVCTNENFNAGIVKDFINRNENTLNEFYLRARSKALCVNNLTEIVQLLNELECQYVLILDTVMDYINYDEMDFVTIDTEKLCKMRNFKGFDYFYREKGYQSDIEEVKRINQYYLLTAFCESLNVTLNNEFDDSEDGTEKSYQIDNFFEYVNQKQIRMVFKNSEYNDCISKLCKINFGHIDKKKTKSYEINYPVPNNIDISYHRWNKKIAKPILIDNINNYYDVKLNHLFFDNYDICMDKLANSNSLKISIDSLNFHALHKSTNFYFKTVYQILSNNPTINHVLINIKVNKDIIDLAELDNVIFLLKKIGCEWLIGISCWNNDFFCEYICGKNNDNESNEISMIKESG